MKEDRKIIKLIQKRVANIAIGASSMRRQGPSGTIKKAREFMVKLDLRNFKDITERQFKRRLNKYTKELMREFPRGAKANWGGARKAINIFLETAFYDRSLATSYRLHKLRDFLELPLDNPNVEKLSKLAGKRQLPEWRRIKRLKPAEHEKFQAYAKQLASENGIARIHLDLYFWRG